LADAGIAVMESISGDGRSCNPYDEHRCLVRLLDEMACEASVRGQNLVYQVLQGIRDEVLSRIPS